MSSSPDAAAASAVTTNPQQNQNDLVPSEWRCFFDAKTTTTSGDSQTLCSFGSRRRKPTTQQSPSSSSSSSLVPIVNEEFRLSDFQSAPGGNSVIDPKVFQKVYNKAYYLSSLPQDFVTFLSVMEILLGIIWATTAVTDGAEFGEPLAIFLIALIIFGLESSYLQNVMKHRIKEWIDSYKPFFHEKYDIELGIDEWDTGKKYYWTREPIIYHGIYLRRCRRRPPPQQQQQQQISIDDDAALRLVEEGDNTSHHDNNGNQEFGAPIFLQQFIPGDIDITMTQQQHDVDSIKVGAMTWNLLRSTHDDRMMTEHRTGCTIMWYCGWILLALWLYGVVWFWLWEQDYGMSFLMVGPFFFFIIFPKMVDCEETYKRQRICEETARLVTESSPETKDGIDWVVEFHTSYLSGRRSTLSERYISTLRNDTHG